MTHRGALIEQHMELVAAIAGKLKRSLARNVEFDDLVGYGSKGLVEAAERFDASHGVNFKTFAYYRIKGAMLDGLRSMGWYGRADYARYRAEERANEYLQNQAEREAAARRGGAPATEDAGAVLESIGEILEGIGAIHIVSMEHAAEAVDDSVPAADQALERHEDRARARAAVAKLPERERQLMELYYFEGLKLEEAGARLGLSKSWACRLHARAVDLLRPLLAEGR